MSLEELWELFPIVLCEHDDRWKEWAREEIDGLARLLGDFSPEINHIGSTAVPGIMAKPIVDILVEVESAAMYDAVCQRMEGAGYICMSRDEMRMSFNKGYTPDGYAERVFHIHVHLRGDNAEVAFRDYLIAHPAVAREYEALKKSLLPRFRNDRDGYTDAKSSFISAVKKLQQA